MNDSAVQVAVIAQAVSGGGANVQEFYPLSPLQEGMLFHHRLNENSDPYILSMLIRIGVEISVDRFANALQKVIDRHDVLRSAMLWEGVPEPLQIVQREAPLPVRRLVLDRERDVLSQLKELMRPGRQQIDLRQAPLIRLNVAEVAESKHWYALLAVHHLICDHQSLRLLVAEARAVVSGREQELPSPIQFREYVRRATENNDADSSERFFRQQLADFTEASAPFGLLNAHGDGSDMEEIRETLDPAITSKVREQARRLGVSPARIFHAAWALVVARISSRDDVVFGTVLSSMRSKDSRSQRPLGLSVNTLPLRLQLKDLTAEQLVLQTDAQLKELLNHSLAPLTLAQRCSGVEANKPLFTTLLNYRRGVADSAPASGADVEMLFQGEAWTNYPITLTVDDVAGQLELIGQVDRRIHAGRLVSYARTAVQSLAHALEAGNTAPALFLQVLPGADLQHALQSFNHTAAAYHDEKLIHQLFEEQVERTPHAMSLVWGDQYLTYRQLNRRANQLAARLRALGVGPECFVGLCVERSIEMVVGLLGILKAGAAYVPLDPSYPAHRLEYILNDTAPKVVLTQARLKARIPPAHGVLALDEHWHDIAAQPTTNLDSRVVGVKSTNLAYVIYTSGSTGKPKGVVIEHHSAVNLIEWARSSATPEDYDQTLFATSLNFDLSVFECFVPLSMGGSLRIVENALAVLSEPVGVTLINTVPSAVKGMLDGGEIPGSARSVNVAGEVLGRTLVERVFANSRVACIRNLYGPSETTTYSTWIEMTRETGFLESVGGPIANTQVYVLDDRGQVLPVGVVGEIYIGGAGVARGYLNRPDLTAQRFLPNPFVADPHARLFKTGDLGRWMANGVIEFLGRNDNQVKVRGYRIELGEIEAAMTRHEQVQEAVVVARQDVEGDKRLVAYLIARRPSDDLVESLRESLRSVLPRYMVPSAFVILDQWPRTPSGKLDRQALPMPDLTSSREHYEPPQGQVEEVVAGIWRELLRVGRVARDDDFFELGGHSLLATRLNSRIRELMRVDVPLKSIFDASTLRQLAACISAQGRWQTAQETGRIEGLAQEIRDDVYGLDHAAVLARIEALESQLGT